MQSAKLTWEEAPDITRELRRLIRTLPFHHVDSTRIFCYRTQGAKSQSYARIWSFPKIFQRALHIKAAYVVEVLAKRFDKLGVDERQKVLIHELLHIPKNFSGALLPHRGRARHIDSLVNTLFKQFKKHNKTK